MADRGRTQRKPQRPPCFGHHGSVYRRSSTLERFIALLANEVESDALRAHGVSRRSEPRFSIVQLDDRVLLDSCIPIR